MYEIVSDKSRNIPQVVLTFLIRQLESLQHCTKMGKQIVQTIPYMECRSGYKLLCL